MGDFNAHISEHCSTGVSHKFGRELMSFCIKENLCLSDILYCNVDDMYTFHSDAHDTDLWLDHILCTQTAHNIFL